MLHVVGLSADYGGLQALADVSVEAEAGSITAIVGSNGAGKTTLLKAISGLIRTSSGEIRLLGSRIDRLPPHEIVARGIALVPEGRELFPRMSVLENLILGAHLTRDRVAVSRTLQNVYRYFPVLAKKTSMAARNLSGGEQQMLAFGRALMASPKLLMLDEPSTGLAPQIERALMEVVRQLAVNEQIGVILVEQNASLALRLAKRAYVLELGRIVMAGPAEEIARNPVVQASYLGV